MSPFKPGLRIECLRTECQPIEDMPGCEIIQNPEWPTSFSALRSVSRPKGEVRQRSVQRYTELREEGEIHHGR